jgi:hypothetical protein
MERCKHQKRGCIEGKSTKRMKVQKAREGMHTYNIYIQSLQAVQGGNQHPDSTPEDAMLPSLIALPLFANRLVRKGERDGDSRPGCSRQSSGGPAPVVSDIEGCMRCRSVSGAAKLFAIAVHPEHDQITAIPSRRRRDCRTVEGKRSMCQLQTATKENLSQDGPGQRRCCMDEP